VKGGRKKPANFACKKCLDIACRAPELFLLMPTLGLSPSPFRLFIAKIQKPNELITALSIKAIFFKKKIH
jgi:hypothetical protein